MNRIAPIPEPTDERLELIPTRASLLERLRLWSDNASWQDFFDTYWKLIYGTARAAGLSPTESEDVVQETVFSVARHMPDFKYRPGPNGGSFKSWLLRLTKWRIKDQFRRRQRDPAFVLLTALDGESAEVQDIPDPLSTQLDERWEADWERNLLDAALERLKRTADPKHYQIFHLHAVKQLSAVKVARQLRVSVPRVYTVKHRLAKELSAILKALRRKHEDP